VTAVTSAKMSFAMSRRSEVETVTGSAPPEIAEQNASGAIAEHYADIRDVTQRPVINLLFRAWCS
jgi:hypothetical protein